MTVKTIKRQTRGAYSCLVAGQSVWVQVSLWPVGCTPALCVTQQHPCSCGMCLVALHKVLAAWLSG